MDRIYQYRANPLFSKTCRMRMWNVFIAESCQAPAYRLDLLLERERIFSLHVVA